MVQLVMKRTSAAPYAEFVKYDDGAAGSTGPKLFHWKVWMASVVWNFQLMGFR
jgi:hypothetical protein